MQCEIKTCFNFIHWKQKFCFLNLVQNTYQLPLSVTFCQGSIIKCYTEFLRILPGIKRMHVSIKMAWVHGMKPNKLAFLNLVLFHNADTQELRQRFNSKIVFKIDLPLLAEMETKIESISGVTPNSCCRN